MKIIDISTQLPYSPLIPAMKAICESNPGDSLEFILNDSGCFSDLKEYLSEQNIGFREIYKEDRMFLQFTLPGRKEKK